MSGRKRKSKKQSKQSPVAAAPVSPRENGDEQTAGAAERPGSGLEMLIGTERYRVSARENLDEGMMQHANLIDAAATLLWDQSEKINNSEEVTFHLSFALSEILSKESKRVEGFLSAMKLLAVPPDTVHPAASVHFPNADGTAPATEDGGL